MPIREATPADIPALVAMGGRFLARTRYGRRIAHNPQQLAALAENLIASPAGIIFVSENRRGEADGMIGMMVFAHPMSGESTASEVFWWGEGRSGGRLFRRARQWAKDVGATLFHMISPAESPVGAFLGRRGFDEVETVYQERL